MKAILLLCILLTGMISVKAQDPTFLWAKQMGGTQGDEPYAITLDTKSNVYTTGEFKGTSDFDPGTGVFNLTSPSSGNAFISKLDSAGNFIWAKQFTPPSYGVSIKVDLSGNVYVTGNFNGTGDFDPGTGVYTLTSFGDDDIFVCKLDSSGNFVWARQFGGSSLDQAKSIAVSKNGEVYFAGNFGGTADFDPGPGTFNLISPGLGISSYISKLDSFGNFIWAKQIRATTSATNIFCNAIALDSSENVYAAGGFGGLVDFDPGPSSFIVSDTGKGFILTLDSAGNFGFVKKTGGTAYSLCLDVSSNLIFTGEFQGNVDFDPDATTSYFITSMASKDIYVSKLSATGTFLWAISIGDTMTDWGRTIQTDFQGNVYCAGYFAGVVNFNPGGTPSTIFSTSPLTLPDGFVLKLDPLGSFKWAIKIGSTNFDYCDALAVNLDGDVFTAGHFRGTVDFDPGPTVYPLTSYSSVPYDIFIQKLDQCQNSGMSNDTSCNFYTFSSQTYTSSGTYFQLLSNALGCDSVHVLNLVIHTIDTTVTANGFTLNAGANGATYQWVHCPSYSNISGATNQSYTATSTGDYAVIISQNACTDTSACHTLMESVGLTGYVSYGNMEIFPNPSTGETHLSIGESLQNGSIKISNITGQIVLQQNHLSGKQFSFDLSNQAKGIYLIELNEDGKIEHVKIEVR